MMANKMYKDIGYAKVDTSRQLRKGYLETIYCEGKEPEEILGIFKVFYSNKNNVLLTRVKHFQYEFLKKHFKDIEYNKKARTITMIQNKIEKKGEIAICTAGTSDIGVAEEAFVTAEFFGSNVKKYYDVGIAGIHRLLDKIEEIKKANIIIAIAGMEGALPSVIAGLVDIPVIAVPTSVGYGTSFKGISALMTMLNSCAEGITVVNIDNGFGAGYSANQINRKITGA